MTDDQIRAAGGPNDDTVSVDLNAVRHDDEFLDALIVGSALPLSDAAERELGGLLFAWRTESLAAPAPVQPTLADVEKAIAAQETAAKRRAATRHLRLISGAAAITAVAAAGLLVLSENSQPGDPLWNVKKVVFAEEAKQTQATVDVQNNLERAEEALAAGDTGKAVELVDRAERDLRPVSDPATRERMQQWIKRLRDDDGQPDDPLSAARSSDAASLLPTDVTSDSEAPTSVTVTVTPSGPSSQPSSPPSSSSTPSSPSSSVPQSSGSPSRPASEQVSPVPSR
ncbi:anti-sigma-D factor RsdA [Gordonia iterans]